MTHSFDLIGKLGVKNGIVLWPLRVAVSGKAFTPGGGVEISYLIGKEDTLARIRKRALRSCHNKNYENVEHV